MSIFHNNILAGAAGAGGAAAAAYQINRSLRFNDDDTAHLSRTPSSAGNRKTWTWSAWVKRSKLGDEANLFSAGNTSTEAAFRFNADDTLQVRDGGGGELQANGKFRDPSAWYHIVVALDNTQSTNTDRFKLYINGVEQTYSSASYASQDTDSDFNTTNVHYIGRQVHNNSNLFDGYLAEVHWVDGTQLAASDFGEYDSNGVWQPKEFTGSHNASGRNYTSEGSTSGSFYTSAGGAASKMFDGDATTGAFSSSGTATFTFGGSTITASSSLKVRAFKGDASGANVLVNGTDISSLLNAQSSGGYSTVDITSTLGGAPINLSNVSVVNASGGSGNIAQIFVDDAELVDLTPGVNGFHLDFSDNSSNAALGTDSSGNSNTWTVNNLTAREEVWSNYLTTTGTFASGQGPEKSFDNSLSGADVPALDGGQTLTWAPPGGLAYSSKVEIYVGAISGFTYSFNGATAVTATTNAWNTVDTGSGTINTLVFDRGINETHGPHAIRVDNVVLVDGTPSNTDSLIDTPTNYTATGSGNNGGNYATLNPLDFASSGSSALSNGNLDAKAGNGWQSVAATIGNLTSGKWYWEVKLGGGSGHRTGLSSVSRSNASDDQLLGTGDICINSSDGYVYVDGSAVGTAAGNLSGKTVGIALNLEADSVSFYQNGSLVHTVSSLSSTASWTPVHATRYAVLDHLNFGQRPFAHTPPTDHLSLCTQNLDEDAYASIPDGSTAMDVATYSGDGTNGRDITVNHSTDLVWIKSRNQDDNHILADSVRGTNKILFSQLTLAEYTDSSVANSVTAFNSDGFTVGNNASSAQVNQSGFTYAAWSWDAGSSNTSISAGGLNSSVYDQRETWSDSLSATFRGTEPATNAFDGDTSTIAGSAGTITYTSPVTVPSDSTIRVFLHGGAHTVTVNGGSNQTISAGSFQTVTYSNSGNATFTMTFNRGGGADTGVRAIEIGGKLLVDNGVSVTNVPSIATTTRANPSAGFSISTYTGNGSANQTLGHKLGAAPAFVIIKDRSSSQNWAVLHTSAGTLGMLDGGTNYALLELNATAAARNASYNTIWHPTSTTVKIGEGASSAHWTNKSGDDYVMYAWAPVEGFSSFGSYEGNGNANGPFVYTGFKPRFIMIKNVDNYGTGYDWFMFDTARDTYNVAENTLKSNLSGTEYDSDSLDILSNGFKIRATTNGINLNSHTHVYLAFAENPFRISRAA